MGRKVSFDTAYELTLATPGSYEVVVAQRPVLTAHSLIMSAITGQLVAERRLHAAVLNAIGREGLSLYAPVLLGSRRTFYPRGIVPELDGAGHWASSAGDAIGDLPTEVLVDQLHDMQDQGAGPGWDAVLDRPRPWLTGVARAFTRVCTAITPWWRQTASRRAVEEARLDLVGATPTGCRHFVNGLSPSVRLDEDALRAAWTETSRQPAGPRIELTPMVTAGVGAPYLIMQVAGGTAFGYSMAAGLRRPDRLMEPTERLEALLGDVRSLILRELDRPLTHTQLADRTGAVISTVSHHVDKLVAAGLVVRMRLGRHSWVIRTAEGDELLELLD